MLFVRLSPKQLSASPAAVQGGIKDADTFKRITSRKKVAELPAVNLNNIYCWDCQILHDSCSIK
jgi:hypothetical protein